MNRKNVRDVKAGFPSQSKQVAWWYSKGYRQMYQKVRPGLELPPGIRTSEDMVNVIKSYGFNNIEFGNYLSEEDKFNYLISFYFAIYDMNKILGFQKNMGMDGMLTIGFGSRGIGRTLAHYNPRDRFININRYEKTNSKIKPLVFFRSGGINSFAHEYAHALDYILGGHVERSTVSYPLSLGDTTARKWDLRKANTPMRHQMNVLIYSYIWKDEHQKAFTESYSKIASETDYYRQHNEIFARLFEKYIFIKLQQRNIQNLALTKQKYDRHVYATDRDMKFLIPIMDNLVSEMRSQITLKYKKNSLQAGRTAASTQGRLF